jgi:hypothetical protein
MSDHHNQPTNQAARKAHRCISCAYGIPVGERYVQQTGFYEGARYRNKYHQECWDALVEEHDFEFMPGSGEPPERLLKQEEKPCPR